MTDARTLVCVALKKLGFTYEKAIHAAERDRPDVAERRVRWRADRPGLDPRRLIFIDGTWAKMNMTRPRGRARRGERLIDKTPHGHRKLGTPIAALGLNGVRCSAVVDGAVHADISEAFVEQVLVPELKPGDVVVMDNLSSYKRASTLAKIEALGAVVNFPPPCSLDLNPIEMIFRKIKQALRSLACRTVELLWSSMQAVARPRDAERRRELLQTLRVHATREVRAL